MSNKFDVFSSKFAQDIYKDKYSMDKTESWCDTCKRVSSNVCGPYLDKEYVDEIYKIMLERKFIPGGRYLYSAGRPWHQIYNCFSFKAEDSREGWADLMQKITLTLMSGGGVGCVYSNLREEGALIKRTGGVSTGPIALMHMVNEAGRHIMNGGNRRSAIWAGLDWKHPDIDKFIKLKDWGDNLKTLKSMDPSFQLPMENTNISVIYDTEFFIAIDEPKNKLHQRAKDIWNINCRHAFETGEPGYSFNFRFDNEDQRNACQPKSATVIKKNGISTVGDTNIGDDIWDGSKWVKVINKWSTGIKPVNKYTTTFGSFVGTDNHKVVSNKIKIEVENATSIDIAVGPQIKKNKINQQDVMDGLIIGDGSFHKASNNLMYLNIGVKDGDYFKDPISKFITKKREGITPEAYEIKTTITYEELPKTYLRTVPDRFFYGNRHKQVGFLRGLFSANGSVNGRRVCLKQSSRKLIDQVQLMLSNLGIPSYITTNKSKVIKFSNGTYTCKESYDINITTGRTIFKNYIGFIQEYKNKKIIDGRPSKYSSSPIKHIEPLGLEEVFEITVDSEEHVYWTGCCLVSNCTEFTSEDDSDSCNLGSVWINRIKNKEEMAHVVKYATYFLLCGGLYSDHPTQKIKEIRIKNNKIGLGLGGLHEWLIMHGSDYEVTPELHKLLNVYEQVSDEVAHIGSKKLGMAIPKKKRAIAPTGTIGIIAESSTGIEPIFCKAYKRRYFKEGKWLYQYVVDGSVKRLMDQGVKLDQIKDAYDLTFTQRVKLQASIQNYVDMAISSTCNLPSWGTEKNNESTLEAYSKTLLRYSKRLRGFTCYPDGARGTQPLERCSLDEAMSNEGKVFEDKEDRCQGGVCGI